MRTVSAVLVIMVLSPGQARAQPIEDFRGTVYHSGVLLEWVPTDDAVVSSIWRQSNGLLQLSGLLSADSTEYFDEYPPNDHQVYWIRAGNEFYGGVRTYYERPTVSLTAGALAVYLDWNVTGTDVAGYDLHRRMNNEETVIFTGDHRWNNSYTDFDLQPGSRSYRVEIKMKEGGPTQGKSVQLDSIPVYLHEQNISALFSGGDVLLSWFLRQSDVAGFELIRTLDDDTTILASGSFPDSASFRDVLPPPGDLEYALVVTSKMGAEHTLGPARISVHPLGLHVHPVPFGETATITFANHTGGKCHLAVYDIHGRRVASLVDRTIEPGQYIETWNGTTDSGGRSASGVYFVRIKLDDQAQTRKIIYVN